MLACAGAALLVGQASAQANVHYWLNNFGDAATSQPSVINVVSGGTAHLSVYLQTSGVGALSGINAMFGYSSTTSAGSSATAADTNATFNSFNWAQADLVANQVFTGAGGGGVLGGGSSSRPYGYFVSSLNVGGTFAGTGDGVNYHLFDITLNINAAAGTDIGVGVWSSASSSSVGTDFYASAVLNGNNVEYFPTSPYSATLHVVPVPEPASIAALAIGAAAFLRRRRSK